MIAAESLSILQELINVGVGRGAQVLNTLLNHHVVLDVPVVTEVSPDGLVEALGVGGQAPLAAVQMGYRGPLEGEVQLLFGAAAADAMVNLLVGEDYPRDDTDFIRQSTLTEVGNIVINAVVGTLSNLFGFHLEYSLPAYLGGTAEQLLGRDQVPTEAVLLARTRFRIEDLAVDGHMILFFSMPTYQKLEEALVRYGRG